VNKWNRIQAPGSLLAKKPFGGEAEKAGMSMPNTKLLTFGNPKAGTPINDPSPTTAIDLPLKVLVSKDKCWRCLAFLQQHEFPSGPARLPSGVREKYRPDRSPC